MSEDGLAFLYALVPSTRAFFAAVDAALKARDASVDEDEDDPFDLEWRGDYVARGVFADALRVAAGLTVARAEGELLDWLVYTCEILPLDETKEHARGNEHGDRGREYLEAWLANVAATQPAAELLRHARVLAAHAVARVRAATGSALRRARTSVPEVEPLLRELAADAEPVVRAAATFEGLPAGFGLLPDGADPALIEALSAVRPEHLRAFAGWDGAARTAALAAVVATPALAVVVLPRLIETGFRTTHWNCEVMRQLFALPGGDAAFARELVPRLVANGAFVDAWHHDVPPESLAVLRAASEVTP